MDTWEPLLRRFLLDRYTRLLPFLSARKAEAGVVVCRHGSRDLKPDLDKKRALAPVVFC
jgi:hypothetical protein